MSHEHATSQPPPSANPSTIAIVGLFKFQIASIALSLNISLTFRPFTYEFSNVCSCDESIWLGSLAPQVAGLVLLQ